MSGKLGPTLDYLCWVHLAAAVAEVFRENQRDEGSRGVKASADVWATHSDMRNEVWRRVRDKWCKRTGLDVTWFPYSADGTARLYFRFRKRNEEEVAAWEAEIAAAGRRGGQQTIF